MNNFPSASEIPLHPRSLSVVTEKGGTGKTSISTNLAALCAVAGYRTLLIDADPQGNSARDFGVKNTEADDNGWGLFSSVHKQEPLRVVPVRENLDLVPGGAEVELLGNQANGSDHQYLLRLRRAIYEHEQTSGNEYDLVILDSPPGMSQLRRMVLCASRWALVPTRPDEASLDGVAGIAKDFGAIGSLNPDIELLGVVLFGVGTSSTSLRKYVRETLGAELGNPDLVLETEIPYMEAPATNARNAGELVHEYAHRMKKEGTWTVRKRADSALKLADRYERLATEIMNAIEARYASAQEGAHA